MDSGSHLGPTFLQRFEQHEVLGRGGFGVVYRAYDRKLKRHVAVKIAHRSVVEGTSGRRTLQREAEATARLRHPHIVALHEFIVSEQEAMLVSELIEGETLDTWLKCQSGGCSLRLAAGIVARMARAVQHAHDQRVLHRDIKPSNILLDCRYHDGELPFFPMLADFGVARIVREETVSETHPDVVGTYLYTPPEVVYGTADAHSAASDIYSLGVVFYELLVGTRPFAAESLADLFRKIYTGSFPTPRQHRGSVPRDLEAICLRCMAHRPGNRYATASELADDLERFLLGEPVRARHPSLGEHVVRWIRRHPTPAAFTAISSVVLIAFFLFLSVANRQLERLNAQLETSNSRLATALQVSRDALFQNEQASYVSDVQKAFSALSDARLRDVRTFLARYDDDQALAAHRDLEWYYIRLRTQRDPDMLWQSSSQLYCLAHIEGLLAVGGAESTVTLIDPHSSKVVHHWETQQGEVNSVAFDSQRRQLWCSGDDGTAVAYDLETRQQVHRFVLFEDQEAHDLLIVPDLDRLYCLGSHGTIQAIDLRTGSRIQDWPSPATGGRSLISIGSDRMAVSDHCSVTLFNAVDGRRTAELPIHEEHRVRAMAVAQAHDQLLVGCDKSLWSIDLASMQVTAEYPLADSPQSITFDEPRERYLVTLRGGAMHIYGIDEQGRLVKRDAWISDSDRLYDVDVLPANGTIVTVDAAGALRAWPERPETERVLAPDNETSISAFDFYDQLAGEDWPTLVVGGEEGVFLNHGDGAPRTRISSYPWGYANLCTIDKNRLILGLRSDPCQLIAVDTGRVSSLSWPAYPKLALSRDGQWIMGTDEINNRVWYQDSRLAGTPTFLPAENPRDIIVSRAQRLFWNDGVTLMTCLHGEHQAAICLATFSEVPAQLALSDDEQTLAIGLSDREVHLWDLRVGQRMGPPLMHPSGIRALAFTQAGYSLLSVDNFGTLRAWNIATGEMTLEETFAAADRFMNAKFSPDRRHLALQYNDHSLRIVRLY